MTLLVPSPPLLSFVCQTPTIFLHTRRSYVLLLTVDGNIKNRYTYEEEDRIKFPIVILKQ